MATVAWVGIWAVLLVGSIVYAGLGLRIYRRETFPGRVSFTVYCLLLSVTFLTLVSNSVFAFVVGQTDISIPDVVFLADILVRLLTFSTALLAPLAWFRFVLVYTGQRVPTTRRTVLVVGAPIVLTLAGLLVWASLPFVSILLGVDLMAVVSVAVVTGVGYLLNVTGFYLISLLVVGAALIGWTNYTYRHLSTRGGVLFAIGCILPFIAMGIPFITEMFERRIIEHTHIAVGSTLGMILLGTAIVRDDVFASIPAAGTIGRTVTVEEMNDPVVVVDEDHRIVDVNPAAERLFDVSVGVVGSSLSALVGDAIDPERLLSENRCTFELSEKQQVIESMESTLEDEYGRLLGHSIVFHDITDRERREQRIQVLNRVLRHNLRNEMTVVKGYAEALDAMSPDLQEYPDRIQQSANGLLDTGAKARKIQRVVDAEDDDTTPLSEVVEGVVEEARTEYPNCSFRVDGATAEFPVDATVLTAVLRELLDNGARHNDADRPEVEMTASVSEHGTFPFELTVSDNGPGIPDQELTPIREGAETDLEHGSGLGLWLVEWGISTLDGQVEFERTEPRGTNVHIRLPAL